MNGHVSRKALILPTLTMLLGAGLCSPAGFAQDAPPPPPPPPDTQIPETQPPDSENPLDSLEAQVMTLLDQINRQQIEIEVLRSELADAQLRAGQCEREFSGLQKFIEDYEKYGAAYEEYRGVKEIAEREARQREIMEARARYEQIKAARRERYEEARAQRDATRAEKARLVRYRSAGFEPLGLEVYGSRFSYFYQTRDTTRQRIDYRSGFGNYLRLYPDYDIDYSEMTISGSVLNAADEVRNIGVAITFFDENGNQVGHETVQVNNARTDVPYPFTATIKMALNRPFDSSSTYVLYADSVGEIEEEDAPAPESKPDDGEME